MNPTCTCMSVFPTPRPHPPPRTLHFAWSRTVQTLPQATAATRSCIHSLARIIASPNSIRPPSSVAILHKCHVKGQPRAVTIDRQPMPPVIYGKQLVNANPLIRSPALERRNTKTHLFLLQARTPKENLAAHSHCFLRIVPDFQDRVCRS